MVAAPHVPGQPVLRHAAEETDVLQKLLPGGPHTLVSGTAATRDRVLAELAAHPWVHFICHGSQNLTAPATGGLALRDGRLTVADLTASDAIGGEFAFLSACDTALGGVHLPDESITLAAALHHIGYRRVVGTLWPTLDSAAAELVHQTYRRLTGTGRFRPEQTADALHEGVRTLRAAAPTTPSTWASFVHIGA
jgi:CHAT domain-containing protein